MFGLSDNTDKNNPAAPQTGATDNNTVALATPPPDTNAPSPDGNTAPEPPVVVPSPPPAPEPPVTPAPTPTYDSASSPVPVLPGPSLNDVSLNNAYIPTDPTVSNAPSSSSTPAPQSPTTASLLNNVDEDGLIKLKQQALQSLAPLMDHLEQTAEEKFKTTMMLIQASDNSELIQEAFDAANKITDEKVRAQALLDVVNEINYFTHHSIPPSEQSV